MTSGTAYEGKTLLQREGKPDCDARSNSNAAKGTITQGPALCPRDARDVDRTFSAPRLRVVRSLQAYPEARSISTARPACGAQPIL